MARWAHLGTFFFVQAVVPILLLFAQRGLCRELITEEPQFRQSSCNSTVQGRHLRSDDRGYVCSVKNIDPRTGCCADSTKQYSCSGCNMGSQCCTDYEYCVSCCLDPLRTSSEVALKAKVAKQLTAGTSSTVFEYCLGRCRHNSQSVIHENAYVSDEHHCFFPQEQFSDEGPEREDADFGDLTIVIARQGQSCDSACKERQKECKLNTLPALNKCNVLKKYLNCKEACIGTTGTDQPSEVVKTAPRHMHPGSCMFSTQKVPFSCQGSHPYTRRLCPCG
ncbi:hypothetical protein MPTK1_5g11580 [Marchantia polymorpha subsp. ruderalis]|uniref:SREBP regulating gene protein n=2 Tax=Marchantia polymorpha TaxID=3197 RepID=A0AAF6BHB9_MARPO|nr:hypothetical protein MARPO_0093s0081 [Marchantia polymorpha]BBN11403.1 hypothetical protein Mp_5g11580 [Marchantia polymorpha subsp. ruderalis]|eukprot:PTQ33016.1 hypothetical protein MARPO_0093s0081 [Marchantia polymorpha]